MGVADITYLNLVTNAYSRKKNRWLSFRWQHENEYGKEIVTSNLKKTKFNNPYNTSLKSRATVLFIELSENP